MKQQYTYFPFYYGVVVRNSYNYLSFDWLSLENE
jgi:hypothetical protein